MDYISKASQLDNYLKENLSQKRYCHSLEVAKMAKKIASKVGCDINKAYFSGLCHDIAREVSMKIQEQIISNIKDLSNDFLLLKQLYHGPVGAYILTEKFGVKDIEILEGVKYHSVGHKSMCDIAKIVFVADYISEDRVHISEAFRNIILGMDLKHMVYSVLIETKNYLIGKGKKLTKESIDLLKEVYDE